MNKAYSKTGFIITVLALTLLFPHVCLNAKAENAVALTSKNKFDIPAYNGTISFAVNGSYTKATLENNTWTFYELRLNGSRPLGNLKISAQNSKITIRVYSSYNNSSRAAALRYTAEGVGKQIVNLGLNSSQPASGSQWSVIITNNVFLAEGENWSIQPDETIVLDGLTGNVSVVRYGFRLPTNDNLPFYQQHSVAIVTVAALAIIVTVVAVNQAVNKKRSNKENDKLQQREKN